MLEVDRERRRRWAARAVRNFGQKRPHRARTSTGVGAPLFGMGTAWCRGAPLDDDASIGGRARRRADAAHRAALCALRHALAIYGERNVNFVVCVWGGEVWWWDGYGFCYVFAICVVRVCRMWLLPSYCNRAWNLARSSKVLCSDPHQRHSLRSPPESQHLAGRRSQDALRRRCCRPDSASRASAGSVAQDAGPMVGATPSIVGWARIMHDMWESGVIVVYFG